MSRSAVVVLCTVHKYVGPSGLCAAGNPYTGRRALWADLCQRPYRYKRALWAIYCQRP